MKKLGGIFLVLAVAFGESDLADGPGTCQVIISEIMADPFPPVGLDGAEYIELYNRGESPVSLAGCRIFFGDRPRYLPDVTLESRTWLVIYDAADSIRVDPGAKTIAMEKMPSIVNQGMTITLRSPSGSVVHSVEFSDRWYRSADKAGGGWSLEITDPGNCCGGEDNWGPSVDPRGGTPGSKNSVHAANPDRVRPMLLRATLEADSTVVLHFSESMDSASLCGRSQYTASHGLLHPDQVDPVDPAYRSVRLAFGTGLDQMLTYTVTVLNTPCDCAGNFLDINARADFAIPQEPDSFDLVFNEVLFEVPEGTSEFVELLNRSYKTVDLDRFSMTLSDPDDEVPKRNAGFAGHSYLLFPGHCVAITRDARYLPGMQGKVFTGEVAEFPGMFTLPDEGGVLALAADSGRVTDRFRYDRGMQSEFLLDTRGVSLERIRTDSPTGDARNWHSASSVAGFSTPGMANSQELRPSLEAGEVSVSPSVFSPDGDGNDDEVILSLIPGGPGFVTSVMIFDSRGRKVRTLAAHVLTGTETTLAWDGLGDGHHRAESGIYIIYIELFNNAGIFEKFRKVVTLVRND